MKTRIFATTFIVIFTISACNNSAFEVNESGLEYKFVVENNSNQKPKVGDVVAIKMRYTKANGKTVEQTPLFRTQLKKPSHVGGSIEDALLMMHKGDSAIFKISAVNYYAKTRRTALPEDISQDEKLVFYIKLTDITTMDAFAQERKQARISNERDEEYLLKYFLKRSNITTEPTMSGLYFIEIKKGQGITPVPGKKVMVNYVGYFIDGKVFDSSYDRNEPFKFNLGLGQVIQGWDEGVGMMRVGGKYKLIIPSHLAYGDVKRGPIPPNSTLIFEIELLDAEK